MIWCLDVVFPDDPIKSTWKDFFSNNFVTMIGLCILVLIIVFVVFKFVKSTDKKSSK